MEHQQPHYFHSQVTFGHNWLVSSACYMQSGPSNPANPESIRSIHLEPLSLLHSPSSLAGRSLSFFSLTTFTHSAAPRSSGEVRTLEADRPSASPDPTSRAPKPPTTIHPTPPTPKLAASRHGAFGGAPGSSRGNSLKTEYFSRYQM